jgi:group I intron endonuclease
MYIYEITNKINGKLYVGQTIKSLSERWQQHLFIANGGKQKYHGQFSAIHAAIIKHGQNNFDIKQIDSASSIDELNEKEMHWIKELKTTNILYNITEGGKGSMGYKHTEIAKLKISRSNSGENNGMYGRKHTDQTLQKYSEDRTGKLHTPDTKIKMSKNQAGAPHYRGNCY